MKTERVETSVCAAWVFDTESRTESDLQRTADDNAGDAGDGELECSDV